MSILPTNKLVKFLALFCGSGVLLLILFPLTTTAAFTKQINYQGKLTNSGGAAVANGSYSVVFKIYNDPIAGSTLWTETQPVVVTSGLFSVMLGSVSSLNSVDFNQPLYLTLNVDGDGEMTPRKTLGSVPNAFNTLTFDGFATSSFLRSDIANATGTINNFTSDAITLNGVTRTSWPGGGSGTDVNWSYNPLTDTLSPATSTSNTLVLGKMGIGAISPGFADFQIAVNQNSNLNGIDIGNLSTGNLATAELKMFNDLGQTGALFSTGSNYNLLPGIAENSFGLVSVPSHDLVLAAGGNDSINFLTNASTSGVLAMTINGNNVGIGTTTPSEKLEVVNGKIKASNSFDSGSFIYSGSVTTGKSWSDPVFGNVYSGVYGYATTTNYNDDADYIAIGILGRSDYGVGVAGSGRYGGIFRGSEFGVYSVLGENFFAGDINLQSGLKDNSGNYGLSGNVLLSTGSGVSWSGNIETAGNINIPGSAGYLLGGQRIITASTSLNNYFLGEAGNTIMTGSGNLGAGLFSLFNNSTGTNNVALGSYSLRANTSGGSNIALGIESLVANTTGNKNIAIGESALSFNISGDGNVGIGYNSGIGNGGLANEKSILDSNASFIGSQASRYGGISSTTPLNNITAIGYNAKVGRSNSLVLGGLGLDAVNVGIGTSTPTELLSIHSASSSSDLLRISTTTNQNVLYINNSGQVGLGIGTFGGEKLSINGDTLTSGLISQRTNNDVLSLATTSTVSLPGIGSGSVDIKIFGNYGYLVFQQNDTETDGLRILDLSNPTSPIIVGGSNVVLPISSRKITVDGKYAYIGSEGGRLSIVDISNPKNPFVVSTLAMPINNSIRDLKIVGKYIYLALYSGNINSNVTNAFAVVDVSNPKIPRIVSGTDLVLPGHCRGLDVNNGFVYLTYYASSTAQLFRVIDVRDPLNPIIASTYNNPNFPYWGRGITASGNYVYLASGGWGSDELNPSATSTFFRIIDVSDPYDPIEVGGSNIFFEVAGVSSASLFQVKVVGHYAHVVGFNVYKIIDISDPVNPFVIASYRDATDLSAWAIDIKGNYSYVVGNQQSGDKILKVFNIGGVETGSLYSGAIEAGYLNVHDDIISHGSLKVSGGVNAGWGGINSLGDLSVSGNGLFQLTATSSVTISNINSVVAGGIDFPLLTGHAYTQNMAGVDLNILGVADRVAIVEQDSLADPFLGFYGSDLAMLAQISVATSTNEVTFGGANGWSFSTTEGSSTLSINTANNTVYVDKLMVNGAVYSNNNILTSVNPSSRAYKNNILDTSLNIDALLGLQVKSFNWNNNGQSDFGLIAEEIQSALPELYMDDGITKGYRADHLPFYLLQIAQRQAKQIIELDNRIASGTIAIASSTETLNVGAIQALSGNWSIGADGTLTVKSIKAEDAIIENGVTVRDRATGSYSCIYVSNGTIQTSTGECSTGILNPGAGSDGGDTGTTTPSTDSLGDTGTSSPAADPTASSSEPAPEPIIEIPAPILEPETPISDPAPTE